MIKEKDTNNKILDSITITASIIKEQKDKIDETENNKEK